LPLAVSTFSLESGNYVHSQNCYRRSSECRKVSPNSLTIFNWLIGQRVSIVDPTAGVTRDRVSFLLDLNDEEETPWLIELIDTGGIGIVDKNHLSRL